MDSRSCVMVNNSKTTSVQSKANVGFDNHAWHRHGDHIIASLLKLKFYPFFFTLYILDCLAALLSLPTQKC